MPIPTRQPETAEEYLASIDLSLRGRGIERTTDWHPMDDSATPLNIAYARQGDKSYVVSTTVQVGVAVTYALFGFEDHVHV